jgi:hypothetical protein
MAGYYIFTVKIPVDVRGHGMEDAFENGKKWFNDNFKWVGEGEPIIEYEIKNEIEEDD